LLHPTMKNKSRFSGMLAKDANDDKTTNEEK
jgi:hypothetical protein